MYIVIYVFTVLVLKISSKYIAIPFQQSFGYFSIPLSFGTPSQRKSYRLDLSIPYTWTSSYFYEPGDSSTLEAKSISYYTLRDSAIQFFQCIDLLKNELEHNFTNVPDFLFLYGKVSGLYYESIGLSYQFNYTNFSFIHSLLKHDLISHLSFTIRKNFYDWILYLGGTSNNITENKHKGSCNVNDSYAQWGCSMSSLSVGNKEYNNDAYVLFNIYDNKLLAPASFLQFMKDNFFAQYVKDEVCSERISKNFSIYRCHRDKIQNFPSITFKFNNNLNIVMHRNQTFDCIYLDCVFVFTLSANNTWYLGTSFLTDYVVTFDYEAHSISFFSPFIKTSPRSNLLFLTMSILFIGT